MNYPTPDYTTGLPSMSPDEFSSSASFNLKWLSGLFKVADNHIDKIYGDFSEFKLNPDDLLDLDDALDFDKFVEYSTGPIIYISVWAVIAIIFTLVGICWCLKNKCICCCRSSFHGTDKLAQLENTEPGFQLRPYYSERNDKKYGKTHTEAIILTVLMGLWLMGLLLIILFTFAANDKTNEAADSIQTGLNTALDDVNAYLGITIAQLEFMFLRGFSTLSGTINTILDDCPDSNIACGILKTNVRENAIGRTETELQLQLGKLTDALKDVQNEMNEQRDNLDENYEDTLSQAVNGMYWFFMLFNLLYCLIFVLVLLGTVLAAAGRSSGLKTGGYLAIRVGIAIMFVLVIFVVGQLILLFVFGGITAQVICPAIKELEDNPGTSLMQDPGTGYSVPTYGQIMNACKRDETAYNAFKLKEAYDIDQLKELVDFFPENVPFKKDGHTVSLGNTSLKIQPGIQIEPESAVKEIRAQVETFTNVVIDSVKDLVGKCEPAYKAVNATVAIFCYKMSAPATSFWWILQFIPPLFLFIIITAIFFERMHF